MILGGRKIHARPLGSAPWGAGERGGGGGVFATVGEADRQAVGDAVARLGLEFDRFNSARLDRGGGSGREGEV